MPAPCPPSRARRAQGLRRLLAGALLPAALQAPARVTGRVLKVERSDTVSVGGVTVVLHRVGPRLQGPVDTVVADARGRFAVSYRPDSLATYLLSVRYGGIQYFSDPLSAAAQRPDTGVILVVADTSSSAPVHTRQRTILVSRADESGTRLVVDWFVISNPGERTRTAGDSTAPSWSVALSSEAQAVSLADTRLSQFSPDAIVFRRDSALLFAPLSPGDKELILQYRIPGTLRRFAVPDPGVSDSLYVLLEEARARIVAPPLAAEDSQAIEGHTFRRWAGPVRGAQLLEIEFPGAGLSSRAALALLVAFAGLGFAATAWLVVRRRRPAAEPEPGAAVLAARAAELDARYQGREGLVPPEEWAAYRAERSRLAERLRRALAAARRGG